MATGPILIHRFSFFRCGLCFASAAVGSLALLVMFGWIIRSVVLTQVVPSFAPMQFNTALMFLLCSVASILAMRGKRKPSLAVSALLITFSSVTFAQYLTNASFGIDTLFVEPFTTTRTSHPGRMAPNTAIAFVLTGLGVVGLNFQHKWKPFPVIGSTLALCLGVLALYGYLAAAENAYGWGDFTRMAIHTATGFVILNTVHLVEAWRQARPESPPQTLPQWLAFVIAMLSLTAGLCAWNSIVILEQKRKDREMRTLSYLVNEKLSIALEADFKAMVRMADRFEGGMRDDAWVSDSTNYLTDIPGLYGIAYFEEGSDRHRIVVLDQSKESEIAGYGNRTQLKESGDRATIFFDKDWQDDSFLISIRIRSPETQAIEGYLVGFLQTESVIHHAIKNEEHRNRVRIAMEENTIFSGDRFPRQVIDPNNFVRVTDPDHPWSVTVVGADDFSVTEVGVHLSTITLVASFLLAALIFGTSKLGIDRYNLQLSRTDEEIREAYDELEALLFVISHDLKEPVRSVNSFAHILEEDCSENLNEDDRELLHRIVGGAERIEELLSDVGTISKAYRINVKDHPAPLAEIVRKQIEDLSDRLQETGSRIKIAHELPAIVVEKVWTGRAVNNLLSNAIKFTSDGIGADITVEPYHGPEGVGIVIKDRGIGVPENAGDRIFELFRRGVGKNIEGTGIGLAIVKKVARKHGGTAWYRNRKGGGAEFYLTLTPGER